MKYLTGGLVLVVVLVSGFSALAYSGDPSQQLQLDPTKAVNGIAGSVNQVVNGLFKGFSAGSLDTTNTNTSSGSDSSGYGFKFFSLNNLSSNDLGSALKAVTILFINVFLVAINILGQILRGILSAISG